VALDREESHHLVRARRARAGDPVVLFDGRGGTRLGSLVRADPTAAVVAVVGPYPDREPRRRIVVATALPAGARADDLVASLAEVGVTRLVPLRCERAAADPAESLARRRPRFERLAREAAKVNGRSRLLEVGDAMTLGDALAEAARERPPAAVFLLDTDPGLPSLAVAGRGPGSSCWLLVGPEGGFTPTEIDTARAGGAVTASVGVCALRTETAAFAAACVMQALHSAVTD
jgi:16S rRNA (uracil1498-N3)-methyltransferase